MCALRDGLSLIKERGLLPIIIESDSLAVINAVKNHDKPLPSAVCSLIEDCRVLLSLLGNPVVKHIYREANAVADFVTKAAVD